MKTILLTIMTLISLPAIAAETYNCYCANYYPCYIYSSNKLSARSSCRAYCDSINTRMSKLVLAETDRDPRHDNSTAACEMP